MARSSPIHPLAMWRAIRRAARAMNCALNPARGAESAAKFCRSFYMTRRLICGLRFRLERIRQGKAAWQPARYPGTRLRLLSGAAQAPRCRTCARIPALARPECRDDCRIPHRLCTRVRIPPARCSARPVRRRGYARVWSFLVERQGPVTNYQ